MSSLIPYEKGEIMKMKKKLGLIVSSLVIFGFTACNEKIEIKDGLVPEEALPYISGLLGTYHGEFDGVTMDFDLRLDGKKAILSSSKDVIDPRCESHIGNLKLVYIKTKNKKPVRIKSAHFDFDPNQCPGKVDGRTIQLSFNDYIVEHASMKADIFEKTEWVREWQCHPGGGWSGGWNDGWGNGGPGGIYHERCDWHYVARDSYLFGRFMHH